jgi:hypothetical protein
MPADDRGTIVADTATGLFRLQPPAARELETSVLLGYDYPIMGFFWSMLIFFLWVAWITLVIHVFIDIFRNSNLGGFAKAAWLIFVILVPFLGVLVYVIAQGDSMAERAYQSAQRRAAIDGYAPMPNYSAAASHADELQKLAGLKDQGILSEQEFQVEKQKLLAGL